MKFEDLEFMDQTWTFEVPVTGKHVHQIFDTCSLTVSRNERLEGFSEGKYVVEVNHLDGRHEWLVLSPDEITAKIAEIESAS